MTPERIQQLIQILRDEVDSREDLSKFLRTYASELDEDFEKGVVSVIQQAQEQEDENVVQFFTQIIQALQQMPQQANPPTESVEGLKANEAEIIAEYEAIKELLKQNTNAAYPRAVTNLNRAQQIGNDRLILVCASILAYVAERYRPHPKLEEAITVYQLASEKALVIGNDKVYAKTQHNLGITYAELPIGERGENLRRAITCFENALRIFTETDFPQDYARMQHNLGIAYAALPTGDRGENLRRAITYCENALRIYTEADFPQDYAMIQNNLGMAYKDLLTGDRGENLRRAIACHKNALRVYTKAMFPQDYARTQMSLGLAYSELPIGDQGENLRRAITCFENALRIFTEAAFPHYYAGIQGSLGNAYAQLPTGDRGENLRRAITCYENTLRIFTEAAFPHDYAWVQEGLGSAYRELPTEDRGENLWYAITCYENASRIYTEVDFPQDYARTQWYLGDAYNELPTGDRGENLRRAITCFENALRIFTETDFPQDYARIQNEYAMTQHNLGNVYCELPTGDRRENLWYAIACYEHALRIFTETDFPYEYAMTQHNLGNVYHELPTGDRRENLWYAIACYEHALRIFTETDFPYEYAMTQNSLGEAYRNLPIGDREMNLRHAIACYENASRIYTEVDFPQDYARTQWYLGNAYNELPTGDRSENLRRAIVCFENSLGIFTEAAFPYEYAKTQVRLGSAYRELPRGDWGENLRRAITCYENALRIFAEAAFPQDYAETQMNLGAAYLYLPTGDREMNLRRAIACFENASRIFTEAAFPQDYAITQGNLGAAYLYLPTGDQEMNLRRAIACFENASRIFTEAAFPQDYARTQRNLGKAYLQLPTGDRGENLRRAIVCFENASRIFTEAAFPQDYAGTQMSLGIAYAQLPTGDREENLRRAIICHENALRIFTEEAFPQNYARTQINLGVTYAQLLTEDRRENLRRAIACFENALRISTEAAFPQDYAKTQVGLGNVYLELPTGDRGENLRRAITYFENALRIFMEARFPQERVGTLYHLACAHEFDPLNEEQNAYNTCAEAIRVLETYVRTVSSAETLRAVAENWARIYHKMVSLCIRLDNMDKAFSCAERGKSRTLVEMLHAAQLRPSETVPEDVREAFLKIREKLDELRYRQQMGEHETPRDFEIDSDDKRRIRYRQIPVDIASPRVEIWGLLDEAQQAYQKLLQEIRELDPEFAAAEQIQPISVKEIKALIPEKTIFVECFTGDDETYLFVLDGTSNISDTSFMLRNLTTDKVFNTLANDSWLIPYYDYLQDCTPEHRQAWRDALEKAPELLAEQFWYAKDEHGKSLAGLAKQSDVERIVFIPHSGLHLLPLHLIPLKQGVRLMDRYEITYAPSATMLRFALQRERNDLSRLFAIANPDRSLIFTDGEVQGILHHFDQQQVLWHEQVTKESVYEQATAANIVHFSCHGNFRYGNPMESCLLLAGDDKDKKDLTLRDIFANLKLPNAAAVVLSACETGMVQLERGDEYIGLPSGFLYAGTPTVISSLWAVDDLSTSLLMNRWYENVLQKKLGKAAALRDAQLWVRELTYTEVLECLQQEHFKQHVPREIIRSYKLRCTNQPNGKPFEHPYYWGAFTCNESWK